jgi:hypothetical protein
MLYIFNYDKNTAKPKSTGDRAVKFLAPNGRLVLGQNWEYDFTGRYVAKDLELASGSTLTCRVD